MKRDFGAGSIGLLLGAVIFAAAAAASPAGGDEKTFDAKFSEIRYRAGVPAATPLPDEPKRKNNRPPVNSAAAADKSAADAAAKEEKCDPCYEYRFEQPGRSIESIKIVHNSAGDGYITFSGRSLAEEIREPLKLSDAIIAKLRSAFDALNFLNSTEDYQFEKDYSHLGTVTITLRDGGRQRTARFNWTTNQTAKILMDEYRRISQREIWRFEFERARENQPLETPRLIDAFESLLDRNEIADPAQMLPLFRKMETDERLPLIARNHAGRLVKKIEKLKSPK